MNFFNHINDIKNSQIGEIYNPKLYNPPDPYDEFKKEKMGAYTLSYLYNGDIVIENGSIKDQKLMKLLGIKFNEDFSSMSRLILPRCIFKGKPCIVIAMRGNESIRDFTKGMDDYYRGDQWRKDIAAWGAKVNFPVVIFDKFMKESDEIFKERMNKADNGTTESKILIAQCFFLYHLVKTGAFLEIISLFGPEALLIEGELCLISFGLQVVFDFDGFKKSLKNRSLNDIAAFLGELTAWSGKLKNMKPAELANKRIKICANGKIKVEPIPVSIKKIMARMKSDKELKRLQEIKNALDKETRRRIYRSTANMPDAGSPKVRRLFYKTMLERKAWQAEIRGKLSSMNAKSQKNFLKKLYHDKKTTIPDKFEIAGFALDYGHYDLAVSLYSRLYEYMKIVNRDKIDFYPGETNLSEGFKIACWADIYYSMYFIWQKSNTSMTKDFNFNMVKDAINAMKPDFKKGIKRLLKDPQMQYRMKDNEILIE